MYLSSVLIALGLSTLASSAPVHGNSTKLPTIDLGYGVYRASSYNETYDYYTFSNIRFAAPPTGDLRFGAPQAPLEDRSTIHNGSIGFTCPQAIPGYLLAQAGNTSTTTTQVSVSEDCLFLDVIVPRKVLSGDYGKVPVLFWIYGGGYTLGSKDEGGDPMNLLKHSPSPVIFVAPNYRLGAFGWLAGPTFTLSEGTVPNAGLYDQIFALKWVQKNIHLFHGSKDKVTVMGVSAGGGSIMHLITAFGGRMKEKLFKRAIPIDPGYMIQGGHATAETGYTNFENAAGCTGKGIECLRAIPSETLQLINQLVIYAAPPPGFGYGPAIDGNLVPDAPQYLFGRGLFNKDVTILVTDDIDEGSSFIGNITTFSDETLASTFPGITDTAIAELEVLYPPASNSTPYTTEKGRLIKMISDTGFNCNRYAMSAGHPNSTYNLLTSIEPGTHGTWTQHIFNDIPGAELVIDKVILDATRRFVMNFVVGGTPNELPGGNGKGVGPEQVVWPVFGQGGRGLNVTATALEVVSALGDKTVCDWWAKELVLT